MKSYIYKLREESGRILFGYAAGADRRAIKEQLRSSPYYLISISSIEKRQIFSKTVDFESLLMFTHRLTSLIESGIPILSAMNILWRQTENKTMQLVISHIHKKLEEGRSISEALNDFPRIFSTLYRSLVNVAEKTGTLVVVLRQLTQHLEYQKQFVTKIKKATFYPAVVMMFALAVLLLMFIFVVPTFQKVLLKLNMELPLATRIVLALAGFLRSGYFILFLILLGSVGFVLYRLIKKIPAVLYRVDAWKFRMPVFGYLLYLVQISRFSHAMGLLLGAGLPIIQSFDTVSGTISNETIRQAIIDVKGQVEQGRSLYQSFKNAKVFPVMLVEMVGVGESSGAIVKVFNNIARHFDDEIDYRINKLLTLLEPSLIILVGSIVALTLFAIYMPIFSLWDSFLH